MNTLAIKWEFVRNPPYNQPLSFMLTSILRKCNVMSLLFQENPKYCAVYIPQCAHKLQKKNNNSNSNKKVILQESHYKSAFCKRYTKMLKNQHFSALIFKKPMAQQNLNFLQILKHCVSLQANFTMHHAQCTLDELAKNAQKCIFATPMTLLHLNINQRLFLHFRFLM